MDAEYLQYEFRREGYDHGLFSFSNSFSRPSLVLPDGAKVAVVILPVLQHFPVSGQAGEYPNLWDISRYDYGVRVGIFRILETLGKFNFPATVAINASLARLEPLVNQIRDADCEIIGHGSNMNVLFTNDLGYEEESRVVGESLQILESTFGSKVTGWLSPQSSESNHTPRILASHGIKYQFDWSNDDSPYCFELGDEKLIAMPGSYELSDKWAMEQLNYTSPRWADQVLQYVNVLCTEASQHGARVMTLQLHPWIAGQPHRIRSLEKTFEHLQAREDVLVAKAETIIESLEPQLRKDGSGGNSNVTPP